MMMRAARTTIQDRAAAMYATAAGQRRGSRARALVPVALGAGALAGMFSLVSANILAVNFATQNSTFRVYSNYLSAQNAAGYLARTSRAADTDDSASGVAELGIAQAQLAGFCALNVQKLPVAGNWTLAVIAGDQIADPASTPFNGTLTYTSGSQDKGGTTNTGTSVDSNGLLSGSSLSGAIRANNLFINATDLYGYGNLISGMNLGITADQAGPVAGVDFPASGQTDAGVGGTPPYQPTAGMFGLTANRLNVAGLNGDSYGLNLAGSINLPKLKIKMLAGDQTGASGSTAAQGACHSNY